MSRTFDDAYRWMRDGTDLFLDVAGSFDDAALAEPSLLPGWTRGMVLSHVAANADAIRNLVTWAATGEETPMYASPEIRTEGIERGRHMAADALLSWLCDSAKALDVDMAALADEQWQREVVTAQGRTVRATETAWMRTREVYVHVVDLDGGVVFGDLPADFLAALVDDIRAKRGMTDDDLVTVGELSQTAAWLAGRPHDLRSAREIGPWL
ncbi:maleylpyruvate isomerase family mycothiol-dependent enzyme [Gordonia sp. PKS22-38]|uniref:Maleylpyruvate isomerase family mycothiol-dependent enzyme n=1 Tax=Gordonia prachuapensis TaxID=3115651 RepID=A0ABU7MUQ3_9ACTN|nr:maleylpyruvate isomerase family mycothiol-dependent enzyme [Gordonia sp. PKS22-38]